jgi:hypothetical protein
MARYLMAACVMLSGCAYGAGPVDYTPTADDGGQQYPDFCYMAHQQGIPCGAPTWDDAGMPWQEVGGGSNGVPTPRTGGHLD